MGAEDNIKFPTLEVRNPNELSRGPVQVSTPPPAFLILSLTPQTPFQNKLFTRGPVYKKSTADIEEKIREINLAVEAKIEEQEKILEEEPTVEEVEEVIDTLMNLAAVEVVAEEMAEEAIMADAEVEMEVMLDPEQTEEDIKEMVDLKVVDIGESVAEEIAEEIEEEIVEQVKEELVEELVMEEMIKEAVIDELADAEAVEENIVESEITTVGPSEEEVDFGDITEVAV